MYPLRYAIHLLALLASLTACATCCTPASGQSDTLATLKEYLATPRDTRGPWSEQAFVSLSLSQDEAQQAEQMLWQDYQAKLKAERAAEMKAGEITIGDKTLKFVAKTFGDKPAGGRSLMISMHGGGGAPAAVNDSQWKNQQRLYELTEGIYVAPRAPTNTWNLWHEAHIDALFDRLIENMIALEDVNPNRVYLTGYSAGGDGVYQLAPRMADRFAAAAMMAGHPNEASPLGLRNLPMAIHVGENDSAYKRNQVAKEWGEKLKALHADDAQGYKHLVKLHAGRGHWMNRQDAEALPWMAEHTRQPFPKKVVWRQDDVTHTRFYWLATDQASAKVGHEIVAAIDGQSIKLTAPKGTRVFLRLNDRMLNLNEPIALTVNDAPASMLKAQRTMAVINTTLTERGDPASVYSAQLDVAVE